MQKDIVILSKRSIMDIIMKVQEISKRQTWLARAGLITGIAGIIEIIIWTQFNFEGGPNWIALITSSIFFFPLLAGLLVSWKWPFIGGLFLLVVAILTFIGVMVTYLGRPSVNPVTELLLYAVTSFSVIGLPYLLPGILITLSAKRSGNNRQATA
jgi:hypothetical protein